MVDCHSHFLAEMDDGAKSIQISALMLASALEQGVTDIISTSHCYPHSEADIERFLEKRAAALDAVSGYDAPMIHKGCEVHMTCDLSEFSNIKSLCINDTDYMLVEMPYDRWKPEAVDWVYSLTLKGIKPIMAHIERFFENEDMFDELFSIGVHCQVNADSFLEKQLKKKIGYLIKHNAVHVIGSDCHSMGTRKSRIGRAYDTVEKQYGAELCDFLTANGKELISGGVLTDSVPTRKKGFFGIF
jgi:protein-tyrosine phosphatase